MTEPNTSPILLSRGLALFARLGYEAVGVAAVCDAAEVTKPTLYHHFGSKRGLLEAMVLRYGGPVLGRVLPLCPRDPALLPGDTIKQRVAEITRTLWDAARENPDFYRLVLAQYHAPPESEGSAVILPWLVELRSSIEGLFEAAARWHGAFRGRSSIYAHTLLGMIHSWIGLWLLGGCPLDDTDHREAVHHWLHGVFS